MTKLSRFNLLILLFISAIASAQLGDYSTKREILEVSEQWHSLELPPSVFEKVKDSYADIRIYGITTTDTIEAPYLLRIAKEVRTQKEVTFELINTTSRQDNHFYTFEVPTKEALNTITLDFKNEDFDWNVRLEGSQDQSNWYTLLEDYRILSIKNNQTDYSFTHLKFPNAKYRYYRLSFRSETQPELKSAKIYQDDNKPAEFNTAKVANLNIFQEKDKKQTLLQIDVDRRVPISFLSLDIANTFDYYRTFKIQYVQDSVSTEKGWKYNYRTVFQGTLNSVEKNEFKFGSVLAKKLRLIIENHDNQPLEIKGVNVKGYVHRLIVRFSDKGQYFLTYGNANAKPPLYDLSHAVKNIPEHLPKLSLEAEIEIPKSQVPQNTPLFENKMWLWAIMGIIILVLGGFTLQMMTKK